MLVGWYHTHPGMGVIPADQHLARIALFQLLVQIYQAVVREGQVGPPLPRMSRRQRRLDDDERSSGGTVATRGADQGTADLMLEVAAGVGAAADVRPGGHEDRQVRLTAPAPPGGPPPPGLRPRGPGPG